MLGDDVKFSTVYCVCRLYGLRLQGWYEVLCGKYGERVCGRDVCIVRTSLPAQDVYLPHLLHLLYLSVKYGVAA